jgi:hypothetical protein
MICIDINEVFIQVKNEVLFFLLFFMEKVK